MKKEIWKAVPNYKKIYQASDKGRVRSLNRVSSSGHQLKGKILKNSYDVYGYLTVTLYRGGEGSVIKVHRLVLLAFIGPCPKGMECCHWDGNRSNNKLSNLRWDTHTNNVIEGVKVKLSWPLAKEIRKMYVAGEHYQWELSHIFKVSLCTVRRIINNQSWVE